MIQRKMRGRLVTVDGKLKLEMYYVIHDDGTTTKVDTPVLYDIDRTFVQYLDYLDNLAHRNLVELMIDDKDITIDTVRNIVDFIPLHIETARLQLAVKKLLSVVTEQSAEIAALKEQLKKQ